jgi:hypothetical protein
MLVRFINCMKIGFALVKCESSILVGMKHCFNS